MLAHIFTWLFVFAIPWQNMVVFPGLGTISKLFGAAAIGATFLTVVMRGKVRPMGRFHMVVFLYFSWVFLSVFWAVSSQESILKSVLTHSQLLLMIPVIWEATPTQGRLISLMQAYVAGAYVAVGSTIYNYSIDGAAVGVTGRFSASGFDPNDLGAMLALGLPMAWYIAAKTSNALLRWINRAYFVFGILAILLTGSRGALLVTVMALVVVPWTLTQVKAGVKIAAVILIVGASWTAMQVVPETLFTRLSTTSTELAAGTLNDRLRIWQWGLSTVPEHPIGGYGPAGWYRAIGLQIGNKAPHSTWLAILVEEGVVGLALYLSIFLVLLGRLRALAPPFDRRVGLTLLASLMVAITPLGWHLYKPAWLVLTLLAAMADVVPRKGTVSEPVPSRGVRYRPQLPPRPRAPSQAGAK